MDKKELLEDLRSRGLIAVVRSPVGGEAVLSAVDAIVEGGVTCIEITLTTPDALKAIEALAGRYEPGRVLVGAGTVTKVADCESVVSAGAQYVVTPVVSESVAQWCAERGVPSFMGAFTPTEILTAWEAGADMVKVFPANPLGPSFLRAVNGPFPHIPLVPTGGIAAKEIQSYISAGAAMIGCGGQLCPGRMIAEGDFENIHARSREFAVAMEHTHT